MPSERIAVSGRVPVEFKDGLIADFNPSNPNLVTFGTGSNVAALASSVGGWVVTQSVDADRPVWSATSINGRPGITYDGTSDRLSGAAGLAALLDGTAEFSAYYVVNVTSFGAAARYEWCISTTASSTNVRASNVSTAANLGVPGWYEEIPGVDSRLGTVPHTAGANQDICVLKTSTTASKYIDGVLAMNAVAANETPVCDLFLIGCAKYLASFSQFWVGQIGRLLIYNVVHTDAQRSVISAFLRSYYGL